MKNNTYLKEVKLSGYKSIFDVSVEFQNGLNIIIGKNAAGKTNFIKFLRKILSLKYENLNNFSSSLTFKNGKEILFKSQRNIEIDELFKINNTTSKIDYELSVNKKIIKDKKGSEETSIYEKFKQNQIIFDNTFICHGIYKDYFIVDKPLSFRVDNKTKWSTDLHNIFSNSSSPYFIKCITIDFILEIMGLKEEFDLDILKSTFRNVFRKTEIIKSTLKKYSPIEDIRFSDNFNIFITEDNESISVNNVFIEFKIEGDWLPFSNLSDGTKRLFYIISEVFENDENTHIRPTNVDLYTSQSQISRIILIEEPELGIHPHQFHKLLGFLKEEAQNKQIILTTHSPQALDAINPNELNRITIAYSTNSKEGTKLRHLNETEIIKANEYIKEDFLSDYWLYSDLEK
ncbi:AAA family ATPase [Flavobacterium nackdongense]|nr:ATP-binding protein [Flavobacterium nackdongense]